MNAVVAQRLDWPGEEMLRAAGLEIEPDVRCLAAERPLVAGGKTWGALTAMFKRPASIDTDSDFLLEVYTETRAEEMASFGWTKKQLAAFARMQFDLQQRAYLDRYPGAEHSVLILDGRRAGQIRIARSPHQIVLVDIGVVPSYRGRGIATRLITDLIHESQSTRLPLRLCVRPESPAKRLYERLGFRSTGTDATGEAMLWDGASDTALLETEPAI